MSVIWHQVWSLPFLIGVIGNLVATAVLGVPAWIHLHAKLNRQHRERMAAVQGPGSGDLPAA